MSDSPESDGVRRPREPAPLMRFAGLALDLDARSLTRESGEEITLTRGEFALLRVFVTRPGRVVSRDTLLDALANRRFEAFDRSVDVLIGRLRRKIEPDPKRPCLIVTVPGDGYRFDGFARPWASDRKSVAPSSNHDAGPLEPADPSSSSQLAQAPGATVEASPESQASDRSPTPASKFAFGFISFAAAIAAVLFLAAAGSWIMLAARNAKSLAAGHLSIVVLPFANLSGDPAQDYFADGVTDNLTTELSRLADAEAPSSSGVIARSTAFTYKRRNIDAKDLGRELGVRYVLEGSVQRDQNRVRVNAQLVDAESGAHLWADRFEEDRADLFKLEDEIVARLARSLSLALTRIEAEKGRSTNPDAVDLTMQAFEVILRGIDKRSKNFEARDLFERALKIDPDDAEALGGLAETYFYDWVHEWGDPGIDYDAKVLKPANQAISLAHNDSYVYYPKAIYLAMSHRSTEALGAADAGLAANPNDVLLFEPRAIAENSLGRYGQAKADMERAIGLSPHDVLIGIFHVILGDAELGLNDFDGAIEAYRQALNLGMQDASFVHAHLAAAYAGAGRGGEAKAALAEARRLNPDLTLQWMSQHTLNLSPVADGLRKAGLAEK